MKGNGGCWECERYRGGNLRGRSAHSPVMRTGLFAVPFGLALMAFGNHVAVDGGNFHHQILASVWNTLAGQPRVGG